MNITNNVFGLSNQFKMKQKIKNTYQIPKNNSFLDIFNPSGLRSSYPKSIFVNFSKCSLKKKININKNNSLIQRSTSQPFINLHNSSCINYRDNLRKTIFELNDSLFKGKRLIINEQKLKPNLECNFKEMLKYSPSQRSLVKLGLSKKYEKKIEEICVKEKLLKKKMDLCRKNDKKECNQYFEELRKASKAYL